MGRMAGPLAAVVAVAMTSAAQAALVDVDGDLLALPVPEGFCPVGLTREADKPVLRQMRKQGLADMQGMLLLALPCGDVAPVRRGTLETFRWFLWTSLDDDGTPRRFPPTHTRSWFLDRFREVASANSSRQLEDAIRNRLAAQGTRGEVRVAGAFDRDSAAAYSSVEVAATKGLRSERSLVIEATTLLRSRAVTALYHAPHKGTPPHGAVLAEMKQVMAAAAKHNDAMERATVPSRPAPQPDRAEVPSAAPAAPAASPTRPAPSTARLIFADFLGEIFGALLALGIVAAVRGAWRWLRRSG